MYLYLNALLNGARVLFWGQNTLPAATKVISFSFRITTEVPHSQARMQVTIPYSILKLMLLISFTGVTSHNKNNWIWGKQFHTIHFNASAHFIL